MHRLCRSLCSQRLHAAWLALEQALVGAEGAAAGGGAVHRHTLQRHRVAHALGQWGCREWRRVTAAWRGFAWPQSNSITTLTACSVHAAGLCVARLAACSAQPCMYHMTLFCWVHMQLVVLLVACAAGVMLRECCTIGCVRCGALCCATHSAAACCGSGGARCGPGLQCNQRMYRLQQLVWFCCQALAAALLVSCEVLG
jgi:hypothetical protein